MDDKEMDKFVLFENIHYFIILHLLWWHNVENITLSLIVMRQSHENIHFVILVDILMVQWPNLKNQWKQLKFVFKTQEIAEQRERFATGGSPSQIQTESDHLVGNVLNCLLSLSIPNDEHLVDSTEQIFYKSMNNFTTSLERYDVLSI